MGVLWAQDQDPEVHRRAESYSEHYERIISRKTSDVNINMSKIIIVDFI